MYTDDLQPSDLQRSIFSTAEACPTMGGTCATCAPATAAACPTTTGRFPVAGGRLQVDPKLVEHMTTWVEHCPHGHTPRIGIAEKCGCAHAPMRVEAAAHLRGVSERLRLADRSHTSVYNDGLPFSPSFRENRPVYITEHAAGDEFIGSGAYQADVMELWRQATTSLYGSSDLPALAAREALQNAVDAIRQTYVDLRDANGKITRRATANKGDGIFSIWVDEAARTITYEDNGVGMNAVIENGQLVGGTLLKFFTLGGSGKRGAAGGGVATGGFGVAKAVILGSGTDGFELHTQDWKAVAPASAAGRQYDLYRTTPRAGTRLIIRGVDMRVSTSRLTGQVQTVLERLADVLRFSDIPDIKLLLNGEVITPALPRGRGKRLDVRDEDGSELPWPTGVDVEVRRFSRAIGSGNGGFYVRLNGLFQFASRPAATTKLRPDIVVNLTLTPIQDSSGGTRLLQPGEVGYPLNSARTGWVGQAYNAWETLKEEFAIQGQRPARVEDQYEILFPEDDDPFGRSRYRGLSDEMRDLQDQMADAFKGSELLADIKGLLNITADLELEEQKQVQKVTKAREIKEPESQLPGTGRVDNPYANLRAVNTIVEDIVGKEGTRSTDVARVADAVSGFLANAGVPQTSRISGILTIMQGGATISAYEAESLMEVVHSGVTSLQTTNGSSTPGAGTSPLLAAVTAKELVGQIAKSTESGTYAREDAMSKARMYNPFGSAAMIKVNKENYDARKATWFKKQAGKWIPHLLAWDMTTRLVARVGSVNRSFRPGFILDTEVRAEAFNAGSVGEGLREFLLIMPDIFEAQIKEHKRRPSAIAAYLHRMACHEIAHLPRLGTGHGDSWAVAYEDLAVATSHLIPAIEEIVCSAFKLRPQLPKQAKVAIEEAQETAAKQVREAERALQKLKKQMEAQKAQQPEEGVVAQKLKAQNLELMAHNDRLRGEAASLRAAAAQGQSALGASLEELRTLLGALRALSSYHRFIELLNHSAVASAALGDVDRAALALAMEAAPNEVLTLFRELRTQTN